MELIVLLVNLVGTGVAYLFVPVLFCITKKEVMNPARLKKLCVLNTVCIFALFMITAVLNQSESIFQFVPYVLWGLLAYPIGKKLL